VTYLIEIKTQIILFFFRFQNLALRARIAANLAWNGWRRIALRGNGFGARQRRCLFPARQPLKEAHEKPAHASCHRRRAY
jgi:hypothetical protein